MRVQERFTYDENGIRTSSKRRSSHLSDYNTWESSVEPRVETRYTNEDGVMTSSTTKDGYGYSENIIILRDDNKQPIGAIYNGDVYYYIKNAQGDVTRVVDENGTELVNYSYDPWGEINYCKYNKHYDSGFKSENPIQYRGYERDVHNIFERYYLQSRYYYYPIGRFINADIPDMAKEHKEDINGMNLFAYCQNDPINYTDPTGYWTVSLNKFGFTIKGKLVMPKWEPTAWKSVTNSTNCYAYALNIKKTFPVNYKLQPGDISGVGCRYNDPQYLSNLYKFRFGSQYQGKTEIEIFASLVLNAFKNDLNRLGYSLVNDTSPYKKSGYRVALVVGKKVNIKKGDSKYDYHWYREDKKNSWSHKQGLNAITNKDANNALISNPKKAKRNYYYCNYSLFVGIYWIGVK